MKRSDVLSKDQKTRVRSLESVVSLKEKIGKGCLQHILHVDCGGLFVIQSRRTRVMTVDTASSVSVPTSAVELARVPSKQQQTGKLTLHKLRNSRV